MNPFGETMTRVVLNYWWSNRTRDERRGGHEDCIPLYGISVFEAIQVNGAFPNARPHTRWVPDFHRAKGWLAVHELKGNENDIHVALMRLNVFEWWATTTTKYGDDCSRPELIWLKGRDYDCDISSYPASGGWAINQDWRVDSVLMNRETELKNLPR